MVEFAFVVVLLIALLYGIISYGLILAAQSTVTQAAADGARAGIVAATANQSSTAEIQAGNDVSWMGKGPCYEKDVPSGLPTAAITCTATPEQCPSISTNQCLKVTVVYNYKSSPLFPILPGLGIITPTQITSTDVLQISTPSS